MLLLALLWGTIAGFFTFWALGILVRVCVSAIHGTPGSAWPSVVCGTIAGFFWALMAVSLQW